MRFLLSALIAAALFVPYAAQAEQAAEISYDLELPTDISLLDLSGDVLSFAKKKSKGKKARRIADVAGYYADRMNMKGRPRPEIKRSGSIRLTCTAPAAIFGEFIVRQSGKSVTVASTVGTLKGKATAKGLKAKLKGQPTYTLVVKKVTPASGSFTLKIRQKVDSGLYCNYLYKGTLPRYTIVE